jgi:hypothetical protein
LKITSQKQRNYFGAVSSGEAKSSALSPDKARKMLDENKGKLKNKSLPIKAKSSAK